MAQKGQRDNEGDRVNKERCGARDVGRGQITQDEVKKVICHLQWFPISATLQILFVSLERVLSSPLFKEPPVLLAATQCLYPSQPSPSKEESRRSASTSCFPHMTLQFTLIGSLP